MKRELSLAIAVALLLPGLLPGGEVVLTGLIAASVGETVVLLDPGTGATVPLPSGPVGWLYPAPGGVLFAPDLVHGRTTVVDLVQRAVREVITGVTMPVFGEQADRYLTVAGGEVMVLSYPERARQSRFEIGVEHPWQLLLSVDETSLLVLDRWPDGSRGASLVAVDLLGRQVVYRRRLEGNPVRMALSNRLGVLAIADAAEGRVCLVSPREGMPLECWPVPGEPRDLAFVGKGEELLVAVATPAGAGSLFEWRLKPGEESWRRDGRALPLAAAPLRLAVDPTGGFVAVGLATGGVQLVDFPRQVDLGTVPLTGAPRDVVWCDPARPGPFLPEWSDRKSPQLDLAPNRWP